MTSSLSGPAAPDTRGLADAIKLLVEKVAPAKAAAAPDGAGGLGGVGAALSQVAGAAGAVVGALQQAFSLTQQFVQALQPELVAQFNQAMQDLYATIGVAFTGIFEQGTGFLKNLAAQVAPLFQQLKPVVDTLVGTALKNLTTVVQAVLPLFAALVPVVQTIAIVGQAVGAVLRPLVALLGVALQVALAPLVVAFQLLNAVLGPFIAIGAAAFDGLASAVQTVADLFAVYTDTLGAALASLLGAGDVKDVLASVKQAFAELRNTILVTAARMALLIGATDFVRRQVASLSPAKAKSGEEAAGSTSIKGLEQIGKDLAQASINASKVGEGGDANPNAEVVKKLEDMIAANKTNADTAAEKITRAVLGDRTAGVVKGATEAAAFFVSPVGWAAGKAAKRLGYTSLNPF